MSAASLNYSLLFTFQAVSPRKAVADHLFIIIEQGEGGHGPQCSHWSHHDTSLMPGLFLGLLSLFREQGETSCDLYFIFCSEEGRLSNNYVPVFLLSIVVEGWSNFPYEKTITYILETAMYGLTYNYHKT